jgi:uncharacterized protein (TIGR04222 family)
MGFTPIFNFLISIPGPSFIFFFILFVAASLFLVWVWGPDNSNRFKLPQLTRFDCFSIAALSGTTTVIRTAVFNLWSRSLIKIDQTGKENILSANGSGNETSHPIEAEVLHFLRSPKNSSELFRNSRLKEEIERNLKQVKNNLRNAHLMRSDIEKTALWKFCFF